MSKFSEPQSNHRFIRGGGACNVPKTGAEAAVPKVNLREPSWMWLVTVYAVAVTLGLAVFWLRPTAAVVTPAFVTQPQANAASVNAGARAYASSWDMRRNNHPLYPLAHINPGAADLAWIPDWRDPAPWYDVRLARPTAIDSVQLHIRLHATAVALLCGSTDDAAQATPMTLQQTADATLTATGTCAHTTWLRLRFAPTASEAPADWRSDPTVQLWDITVHGGDA